MRVERIDLGPFAFWSLGVRVLTHGLTALAILGLIVTTAIEPLTLRGTLVDACVLAVADACLMASICLTTRSRIGVALSTVVAVCALAVAQTAAIYSAAAIAYGGLCVLSLDMLTRSSNRIVLHSNPAARSIAGMLQLRKASPATRLGSILATKVLLMGTLLLVAVLLAFTLLSPRTGLVAAYVTWRMPGWIRRLYRRARGESAAALDDMIEYDTRPPIVLLRAFEDDSRRVNRDESKDPHVNATYEEVLLSYLIASGPVVTFGNPSSSVDPLGATRYRVPKDQDWKSVISVILDAAELVVVIAADTDGLSWEISFLAEHHLLSKTIFVVPYTSDESTLLRNARIRHVVELLTTDTDLPPLDSVIAFRIDDCLTLYTSRLAPKQTAAALLHSARARELDQVKPKRLKATDVVSLRNNSTLRPTTAILVLLFVGCVWITGSFNILSTGFDSTYVLVLFPAISIGHKILAIVLLMCWLVSLQGHYSQNRGNVFFAIAHIGTSMLVPLLIALGACIASALCRANFLGMISWPFTDLSGDPGTLAIVIGVGFWIAVLLGFLRFVHGISAVLRSRFVATFVSVLFGVFVSFLIVFGLHALIDLNYERHKLQDMQFRHLPGMPESREKAEEPVAPPTGVCRQFRSNEELASAKWTELLSAFGPKRFSSLDDAAEPGWQVCTERPVPFWALVGADVGLRIFSW